MQPAIFWKHHKALVFTLFFMSTCSWVTNSSLIELGGESILALKNYTLNYLEEADYTFRCVFGNGTLGFSHDSLDNSELDPLKPLRASVNNEKLGELVFLCNTDRWTQIPQDTLHSQCSSSTKKYPKSISIKNRSQECHALWRLCLNCYPNSFTHNSLNHSIFK